MTGRERLNAVLKGERPDRLAWTCLVDDNTLRTLPGGLAGVSYLDFCRRLGCDILLLEGWGTGRGFRSPALAWGPGVAEARSDRAGEHFVEYRTPAGTLRASFRNGHPRKHPVENAADLRIYREMWEAARFEPSDDARTAAELEALVGDDGVVVRFWGPSAVPRLLEYDMGMENFYLLLADHPREMADLVDCMHRGFRRAFAILAAGPCDVVILVENTSSRYIAPEVYERFNGPHVRDFVDIVHAAGKTAIIHMCGHVRGLLPLIRATGLDGVHALTPPPVGDTPWQAALDALGEESVIIGAFDPAAFLTGPVEQIAPALDALYTPRLRRANVILCAFADGVSVPLNRFQAVGDWFGRNR